MANRFLVLLFLISIIGGGNGSKRVYERIHKLDMSKECNETEGKTVMYYYEVGKDIRCVCDENCRIGIFFEGECSVKVRVHSTESGHIIQGITRGQCQYTPTWPMIGISALFLALIALAGIGYYLSRRA